MSDTASPKLPPEVVRLGWVSFFTDIASEMVYPVIPLFLTAVLGAPVVVLGAIEGVAEAVVSLMKGWSGWRSDRTGARVPYVRWGYGLAALSKPVMALAQAWGVIFAARTADRLGKGLRTSARDAMIADVADSSTSGRAFGLHRAMDSAGAIVGVLAALLLLEWLPGHYRTIFLIAGVPGLAAVWLTFRLKDAPRPAVPAPEQGGAELTALPVEPLPGSYWLALVLMSVFAFANSSDTLLILRAKSLGWSDTWVVGAYILFNLTYALASYPLGALSDRFGRWRMIVIGWVIYAVVYLRFAEAAANDVWWLFPLYGLYMALTDGVGKALVSSHVPSGRKGQGLGLFHMSTGIMALLGGLAAGYLWDVSGPAAAFKLGGGVALGAAVVAWMVTLSQRGKAGGWG